MLKFSSYKNFLDKNWRNLRKIQNFNEKSQITENFMLNQTFSYSNKKNCNFSWKNENQSKIFIGEHKYYLNDARITKFKKITDYFA